MIKNNRIKRGIYMKKLTLYGSIIFISIIVLGSYLVFGSKVDNEKTIEKNITTKTKNVPFRTDQTLKVEKSRLNLEINGDSNEGKVVTVMHYMTHQKVEADNKIGAIPMTQPHIDKVYRIVKKSDFKDKNVLLGILNRWKKKDFEDIVKDHNTLWLMQHGGPGKAYSKLTKKEEQAFIKNNFNT